MIEAIRSSDRDAHVGVSWPTNWQDALFHGFYLEVTHHAAGEGPARRGCTNLTEENRIMCACQNTQSGVSDTGNYGWQPPPTLDEDGAGISATFKYENSPGCDGTNDEIQIGRATCVVTFVEDMCVDYHVWGNTEREEVYYDYFRIDELGLRQLCRSIRLRPRATADKSNGRYNDMV